MVTGNPRAAKKATGAGIGLVNRHLPTAFCQLVRGTQSGDTGAINGNRLVQTFGHERSFRLSRAIDVHRGLRPEA